MTEAGFLLTYATIVGLLDYAVYLNRRTDLMAVPLLLTFGLIAYGIMRGAAIYENNFGGSRIRVNNEQKMDIGIGESATVIDHQGLARDLNRAGIGDPKVLAEHPDVSGLFLPLDPIALAQAINDELTPEQKDNLMKATSRNKKKLEKKARWFM